MHVRSLRVQRNRSEQELQQVAIMRIAITPTLTSARLGFGLGTTC
jgi:hypothetical protein